MLKKIHKKIKNMVKIGVKYAFILLCLTNTVELQASPKNLTYASQFDEFHLGYANCGPAVIKMITQDETLTYTEIREKMENKTPEVYLTEFERALEGYEVEYTKDKYTESQTLIDAVEGDHVALILLDMNKIPVKDKATGIGKNSALLTTGHYVIITDYIEKDGVAVFEVIDPYNPKIGTMHLYPLESYYTIETIEESMKSWSDAIFIVAPEQLQKIVEILHAINAYSCY